MNEHAKHSGKAPESIDRYVENVLDHLPPAVPGLHRVSADLTTHLREAAEASGSPEQAVREMGPAEETAKGYAEGLDLEPASLADRTGAFLLDVGLAVPPTAALFVVETRVDATGAWLSPMAVPMILLAVVGALLALLYFPALERLWGQTVGKRFFGLAVTREDGLRVGWWEAVIRRLPLFFEVFWLDALFAPFTEKRQRAFDIVAGTVVVPGVQSGSRTAGWTLVAVLWLVPPCALYLLWGSVFPLTF